MSAPTPSIPAPSTAGPSAAASAAPSSAPGTDPQVANEALQSANAAITEAGQAIDQSLEATGGVAGTGGDAVGGADALKEAVAQQTPTIGDFIERLDAFGFDVADVHISLWSVLVVVLVIVGLYFLGRVLTWAVRIAIRRLAKFDIGQSLLADKLIAVFVWTMVILVGVDLLGIDLTALAFFSGAFGLAIGFGLQKTFGNLLAGIILLMDRSIKPGDVISVTDEAGNEGFGQIRKIGIRAISVVTRDRTEYLIPNENLMINQVVNWSYSSRDVRVKAPVGVAYDSDLELVSKLLMRAAQETKRVLKNPKPRVNIMGFGDSSVDFEVRFWIDDPEEGLANIRSDVYRLIWKLFKEHNIEIPFPQRDLNLRDSKQMQQLIAAVAQQIQHKSD